MKTKYRILQEGNKYTPQYKTWLFWHGFYRWVISDTRMIICDSYKDAMQVILNDKAYVKPVKKITVIE